MQEILTQPKEPVISFDVHKLYRPVEFKLTTIYDASKPDGKGNSKALELAKSSEIKEVKNEFEHHTAWKNVYRMGPGLRNAGNTCFLNSVLQMLTYTSPFANYLLDKGHSNKCQRRNSSQFCALCAFENHVNKCFLGGGNAFEPYEILKNIKLINKKFSIGRQEDSQEFLRDLIDAFQKSCTGFLEKPPQKVLDNTDISKIFGGKLKSSVECKQCHHKSEIFENFFDLSLVRKFFIEQEILIKNRN